MVIYRLVDCCSPLCTHGDVNRQNTHICVTPNHIATPLHSHCVLFSCGFKASFTIDPFLFEERCLVSDRNTYTVTGESHLTLLLEHVPPDLQGRNALSVVSPFSTRCPTLFAQYFNDIVRHSKDRTNRSIVERS
ncbi:hypothetical protein AVEN_244886-1 [Araneus ventricosus]|uniref:Uncharacterized protein n=1 Tax=Araneus ventricosus TaxID=182803 RepID=A0A4Y1ZLE0_ARAVE|nr:hypothetical protein AVEN_190465-1 [Araneus ventricosus]GBL56590.1 hypothetical protein AVEN_244886-1 [Araneus ventricosus]